MCNKLEIPITVFQYDVPAYARERGLSEEEAGRILRYDSFRKVAKKFKNLKFVWHTTVMIMWRHFYIICAEAVLWRD